MVRPNGRARSKLDRMQATREWFNLWSDSTQYVQKKKNLHQHHEPVTTPKPGRNVNPPPNEVLVKCLITSNIALAQEH